MFAAKATSRVLGFVFKIFSKIKPRPTTQWSQSWQVTARTSGEQGLHRGRHPCSGCLYFQDEVVLPRPPPRSHWGFSRQNHFFFQCFTFHCSHIFIWHPPISCSKETWKHLSITFSRLKNNSFVNRQGQVVLDEEIFHVCYLYLLFSVLLLHKWKNQAGD